MRRWFRKVIRWLLNKDELDNIGNELHMIRLLIQEQIPRRVGPLRPVQPIARDK
jgi:hypothetical protein